MYDYKVSVRNYLDNACRDFVQAHNITAVAKAVGMHPATLRHKLNPEQPHQLSLSELIAITDYTEDSRILDGLLRQINCQPSVPINNATPGNMQLCALTAAASVGAIAGEAVSTEHMSAARRNHILDKARDAIRSLSLLAYTVENRIHSAPVLAAAVDIVTGSATGLM
ncbi:phage regulatory CII family protein [Cronobacter turicensis]|nr:MULTISPECIES: phage regulatory CII family protein [Cronobacter]EKY3202748.1 phage regulatory CII family protein [Cronobacter dublinensis]MDK1334474.1 phage regulatory CII family protein [Cronobacter turicensis]